MSYASSVARWRIAAAFALVTTAHLAQAQESAAPSAAPDQALDVSFSAGVSGSDNIGRESGNERSGTIGLAGVQLTYAQNSRRLKSDIDVNATYENYSDDAFDDDVIGGANAELNFGIVPDRFNWIALENFGQVTSDPFAADTPDNRENINYFTTGPDFLLHFGDEMSLRLSARYSDVQYEVAETDGTQYSGTLALSRAVSTASSISIIVDGSRYEFDNSAINTDYDRRQLYLRYEAQGRRTVLNADLGYTTIDIGDRSPDGALARFSLSRRLSPSASLTASLGTQFSDAGEMFRDGQQTSGVVTDTSSVVGTGEPFRSDFGSLGFDFDRNRTMIGVEIRAEHERYETSTLLDRDLLYVDARALRHLSPTIDASVFARLTRQEFTNVDFDSNDRDIGAILSWNVGRRVALRFQYDHLTRTSSVDGSDYTENRASLRIFWSPMARHGSPR